MSMVEKEQKGLLAQDTLELYDAAVNNIKLLSIFMNRFLVSKQSQEM